MPDPSKRRQTNSGQNSQAADESNGMRRRGFLRTSAAAVSLVGFGVGGGHSSVAAAVQAEDVPAYADVLPADDQFAGDNGTVNFASADISALLDVFATDDSDEELEVTPFQWEPLILISFLIGLEFSRLDSLGLGEALPIAATADQELPEDLDPLSDRITTIGDATVTSGSYDADEIATAIDESELTESDTAGVFVGSDPAFGGTQQDQSLAITWSSGYVITAPSVDSVVTVEETIQGQAPRLHEQNDDVARQLADAGQPDLMGTTFSIEGALEFDTVQGFVDYSSVAQSQVQGYTNSLVFDPSEVSLTATSVFTHPSADGVNESALSEVGSMADESTLSRDGRFVTVESVYTELLPGGSGDDGSGDDGSDDGSSDDGGSDDGSGDDGSGDGGSDDGSGGDGSGDGSSDDGSGGDGSGDGSSDDGSGDGGSDDGSGDGGSDDGSGDGGSGDGSGDDGSGDGSSGDGSSDDGSDGGMSDDSADDGMDGNESDGNGNNSSDGSGPGFGLLSALAGVGGASYLLSQRLGENTDLDDER